MPRSASQPPCTLDAPCRSRPSTTSPSSAPATSACRSPPRSPKPAAASSSSTFRRTDRRCAERAKSHIEDVSSERLDALVDKGLVVASVDYEQVKHAHAVLIALPTPLSRQREPDLSFIERAAQSLAPVIQRGQVVVLESTTWPGTTREILQPILEEGSGLEGRRWTSTSRCRPSASTPAARTGRRRRRRRSSAASTPPRRRPRPTCTARRSTPCTRSRPPTPPS